MAWNDTDTYQSLGPYRRHRVALRLAFVNAYVNIVGNETEDKQYE